MNKPVENICVLYIRRLVVRSISIWFVSILTLCLYRDNMIFIVRVEEDISGQIC